MSQSGLDWKNPTGICSFVLLKQFCDNERDILEPYKSIESGIAKPKSVTPHAIIQNPPPPHATRVFTPQANPPPPSRLSKNLIFPRPNKNKSP